MNFKRIMVAGLLVGLVSGCKTTAENRNVALQLPTNNQTFSFQKLSGNAKDVTTVASVKSALKRHVEAHSGYAHCRSGECSKRSTADIKKVWGRKVHLTENEVKISYFNGEKISGGGTYLTKINTAFPYTITEDSDSIDVTLSPATSAVVAQGSNAIFIPISAPVDDVELQKLLADVMTKKGTKIKNRVHKSGEFDVDFAPDTVQTNFERKLNLTRKNNANNRVYENSFELRAGNVVGKVNLKIFLYRGKSKVEYSLSHPVTVTADGKSSYSAETMDKLLQELKKVANS
mgnify:CR=1 FL=1